MKINLRTDMTDNRIKNLVNSWNPSKHGDSFWNSRLGLVAAIFLILVPPAIITTIVMVRGSEYFTELVLYWVVIPVIAYWIFKKIINLKIFK